MKNSKLFKKNLALLLALLFLCTSLFSCNTAVTTGQSAEPIPSHKETVNGSDGSSLPPSAGENTLPSSASSESRKQTSGSVSSEDPPTPSEDLVDPSPTPDIPSEAPVKPKFRETTANDINSFCEGNRVFGISGIVYASGGFALYGSGIQIGNTPFRRYTEDPSIIYVPWVVNNIQKGPFPRLPDPEAYSLIVCYRIRENGDIYEANQVYAVEEASVLNCYYVTDQATCYLQFDQLYDYLWDVVNSDSNPIDVYMFLVEKNEYGDNLYDTEGKVLVCGKCIYWDATSLSITVDDMEELYSAVEEERNK
ncbi:MAG: hypothetical protein J6C58_09220 [Bacteroidaceae bacterium]|nr:hypothetical protein [Bacteroidaceae bacterium]